MLQWRLKDVKDWQKILSELLLEDKNIVSLTAIYDTGSDRHKDGEQALIFEFSRKQKIVYKPYPLNILRSLEKFLDILSLPKPFDLKFPRAILKKGYGWMEFIKHQDQNNKQNLQNYYRRCGSLLAVCDALHFRDGHLENLIASRAYPIIVDTETFFHHFFPDKKVKKRSILTTDLIENLSRRKRFYVGTAFQSFGNYIGSEFVPHVIHERTDKIEVTYKTALAQVTTNCPTFNGYFCSVKNYIKEFIEGYRFTYIKLSRSTPTILESYSWWKKLSTLQSRHIVRDTAFYIKLLCLMQQPEGVRGKKIAYRLLKQRLYAAGGRKYEKLVTTEIKDLTSWNIPYAYHSLSRPHLYALGKSGKRMQFKKFFQKPMIEILKGTLKQRNKEKMDKNIRLLKKILASTPPSIRVKRVK